MSCPKFELWHDNNDFAMLDRRNDYLVRKEEFVLCNIIRYTHPVRTQISLLIERTDREDPYFPIRQSTDTCLSSHEYRVMKLYKDLLKLYYGMNYRNTLYWQARFGGKATAAFYYALHQSNIQGECIFIAIKRIETIYRDRAKLTKRIVSDTYGFVADLELKGLTCPLHLRNSMTSWSLF